MAYPSKFEQINDRMRGQFPRWLRIRRADQGLSHEDIARSLYDLYGVRVTSEAVRSWCDAHGIQKQS